MADPDRAASNPKVPAARPDLRIPLPRLVWRRGLWLSMEFVFLTILVAAAASDAAAIRFAATLPPFQVQIWRFITDFGLSGYMFTISAAVAGVALLVRQFSSELLRRAWLSEIVARAAFFFASVASSGLMVQTTKHVAGRLRPRFLSDLGAFAFSGPTWQHGADSFPSGHTTSAFAAAVALGLMLPRWRVPLAIAAFTIGMSRVMTCNHFPSDVVCGAALGTIVTTVLAYAFANRGWAFIVSAQGVPPARTPDCRTPSKRTR